MLYLRNPQLRLYVGAILISFSPVWVKLVNVSATTSGFYRLAIGGVALTLFLDKVPMRKAKPAARPALVVSDLQAVERDFAFVVDERVEAEAVLRAAAGADRKLIERAAVFDVFAGAKAVEQFGEGRKSVAISVRLQPTAGTLTEAEIEAVAARVVAAVAKATGGTLRS